MVANASAPGVMEKWATLAPELRSVVRMVAAFVFILFGTSKLVAFPAPLLPNGATVSFPSEAWFAGMLETFGGALMLLGLFTRPVAFILSGEMAVAYFQAHFPRSFWPTVNSGVNAVLYCFLWLYFSAAGAGPWSLDAWRRRSEVEGSKGLRVERS